MEIPPLKDIEDDSPPTAKNPTPKTELKPPGDNRDIQDKQGFIPLGTISKVPGCFSSIWALVIPIIMVGLGIWLFGRFQKSGDLNSLLSIALAPQTKIPSRHIVSQENGLLLILEQKDNVSRASVLIPGQATWLNVTRDDSTVANPMLSHDGSQVAFVSHRDGGQIVLVPIYSTGSIRTINALAIHDLGRNEALGELEVCSWSPIVWSLNSKRIAFFSCDPQKTFSIPLVGDIDTSSIKISVVKSGRLNSGTQREMAWASDKQLVILSPAPDDEKGTLVVFIDIP